MKKIKNLNLKIKKNRFFILLFILIFSIIILSIAIFIINDNFSNIEDKLPKIIPDKNNLINDTISPKDFNQAVSLEISRIHKKGIEDQIKKIGNAWKKKPNYYFIATIDGGEWKSKVINNWDTNYVGWEALRFVEDEQELSDIEIIIYESQKKLLRNINKEIEKIEITYDFKTGKWAGDDNFNDSDGYGHYNGNNYEIWFDINQLDNDNDGIPYWYEINVLGTNPNLDDSINDPDFDGIPTSWEWKWGYNPFIWNNHTSSDPDRDGLENIEEYQMTKWLANPFHKDIYIEVDFMNKGPEIYSHNHVLWKESQWMVMDKFSKHEITLHIDDGWPGGPTNGGGEYLRYIEDTIDPTDGIGSEFYKYHFSDGRKGIFRYLFMQHGKIGWVLPQDYKYWADTISLPSNNIWYAEVFFPPAITPRLRRYGMGIVFMHELGHSLKLNHQYCEGIDNASMVGRNNLPPVQKMKEKFDSIKYWETYESIMNYNKFGKYLLDYSDGTHGERDYDDWSQIDLTFFQSGSYSEDPYGIGDDFRNE